MTNACLKREALSFNKSLSKFSGNSVDFSRLDAFRKKSLIIIKYADNPRIEYLSFTY